MNINQLIDAAKEKDAKFKKQIEHRINKRQKTPEFEWLMDRLVSILGEDYVRDAAEKAIEETKRSKEDSRSDGKAV